MDKMTRIKNPSVKDEGREVVDRWTSDGFGVFISPNTPEQQKLVDELNRDNGKAEERDCNGYA